MLEIPANVDGDAPMLVVLHGDREHARDAAARWRSAAKASGWVLLALEVPEGDSWWQWKSGTPDWVIERARAVIREGGIDKDRVYLAGWSGGATFIGKHATAWEMFGGIVIHGGGRAPDDRTACPAKMPAFFLVGKHLKLAVELRTYLEACKQHVVFELVPHGAAAAHDAHESERRALTKKKAIAILEWLVREKS